VSPPVSGDLRRCDAPEGSGQGQALGALQRLAQAGRRVVCGAVLLIVVGLLIAHPVHAPTTAIRERQQERQAEVWKQQGEEEARQREYAEPGGPQPTRGWEP
jgi:hypothetical protein